MTIKTFMDIYETNINDYYEKLDKYNFINKNLTSLEGLPEDFNSEINLYSNYLTSLKGLPKNFNSKIWLFDNEIKTLEGLNDVLLAENIIGLNKDFIIREYIRLGKCHLLI